MKGILVDNNYEFIMQVKRDASGMIIQGMVVGDVTFQNQAIILKAHKGEIKEFPIIGVGIEDMTNDDDLLEWKHEITKQIEQDGQIIEKLVLNENGMTLKAKYK